jgi:DNA modification methylase
MISNIKNVENTILEGNSLDILKTLPDCSVDCCVTSPPYYNLRNYNIDGQIGLEETPEKYIDNLLMVFSEVYRILKPAGTLWLNIGDSYSCGSSKWHFTNSYKQLANKGALISRIINKKTGRKQLLGIPWRVALALQSYGYILRQDIIWAKTTNMPESVRDRFCRSHEYIFLFSKSCKYYFNYESALEPSVSYKPEKHINNTQEKVRRRGHAAKEGKTGLTPQHHGAAIPVYPKRLRRDVWTFAPETSLKVEHYAVFPKKLVEPCILCGCPEGGIILDPFMGSGTIAVMAKSLFRNYIGCEINHKYISTAKKRIAEVNMLDWRM